MSEPTIPFPNLSTTLSLLERAQQDKNILMNFPARIDYILERKKMDPGDEFRQGAMKKVIDKIYSGGSALKGPLQAGVVTVRGIIHAIKHKRCLRSPNRDFGTTYLEQIIGGAIRDVIPTNAINQVRHFFGLDKLSPSELVKHVETQKQDKRKKVRQ